MPVLAEDGTEQFLRISSYLDTDILGVMNDLELSQKERLARVLCMVICDADGIRLFDLENPNDLKIVKAIPNDHQAPLINKLSELIFPSKKKQLKAQV